MSDIKQELSQTTDDDAPDLKIDDAIDLLLSAGYEVNLNGYRAEKRGEHSWTWVKI